ncbi:unnamed protein product, partial [Adineta steineri]
NFGLLLSSVGAVKNPIALLDKAHRVLRGTCLEPFESVAERIPGKNTPIGD